MRKTAIEFLNILSYRRDRSEWEKPQQRKYIKDN